MARQPRSTTAPLPLPPARWTPRDAERARHVAYHALLRVGDSTRERWEYGERALHLRRACTAAEIRGLPAGTLERRASLGMGSGLLVPPGTGTGLFVPPTS